MRRPAPLPASARAKPVAAESRPDASEDEPWATADEQGTDAALGADRGSDADETQPIVPLRPAPGLSPEDEKERELDPDDEAAPVRVRDVWRAARARRRALRGEVRRFTGRARRRRLVWIVSSAALVLLVVGSVAAAYSPLFGVETITVVGTTTLPAADVEAALSDQLGRPLPSVSDSEVKAALVEFPLVESYTLEARPPHDLLVRIVERTPIGVIQTDAGFSLVDAAGVVLATTPAAPEGVPTMDVPPGPDSDAFTAAGLVLRALPDAIRAQVASVSATTRDDVSLRLGATGTQIIWGSADDSPMKALVLETAMFTRPPEGVSVYDVSSPAAIVIR